MEIRTLPGWVGLVSGAVAAAVATGIGYAPELTYLMDVHPGVAGWVQAVGSIAAILVSAALAFHIGRGEERRRQVESAEAQVRALNALSHSALYASNAIAAAVFILPGGKTIATGTGREGTNLQTARELIDNLPLATLNVPTGAVARMLELRSHLIEVRGILEKPGPGGVYRYGAEMIDDRSRQLCQEILALNEEALLKLRGAQNTAF